MIERDLNRRHIRGLLHLERVGASSRADLERAIGNYASNTIASLEARELVARLEGQRYQLTDAGRATVAELRRELAS